MTTREERLAEDVLWALGLKAENKRLREALGFYGDQHNYLYVSAGHGTDRRTAIEKDGGKIARKALNPKATKGETNV